MQKMSLYASPFEAIKSGRKTIEVRLYDEKRQKVKIGDKIEFTNLDTNETILTKCIDLHRADSFLALFKKLPVEGKTGFSENESPEEKSEEMRKYYTKEKEKEYGVIGIELKLI